MLHVMKKKHPEDFLVVVYFAVDHMNDIVYQQAKGDDPHRKYERQCGANVGQQ